MRLRPDGGDPSTDRAWPNGRGLGTPRVQVAAFTISIVIHLVGIALYSSFMDVLRPDSAAFPIPADARVEQGLDVIRLVEIDEDALDRPEEPEEVERIVAAPADARAPRLPGPRVGEILPPGPTAAERLRPQFTDARLWARLPPEFYELTLKEQEELLLSDRIVAWYDSLALAQAAEDRFTDWTVRDGSGGRWGVADGKIYLGGLTLPLPINFGVPVGKRDEVRQLLWEFDEIERQSQRYLIEQSWKERAEAIRKRRDRERAAEQPDTTRRR